MLTPLVLLSCLPIRSLVAKVGFLYCKQVFALFPSRVVALELFGFSVHWYGIMYLLAFVLAMYLLPRLQRFRGLHLSQEDVASLVSAAVIGVIIGGRLGYVLFYEPSYYLTNPLQIFAVWNGGMSSHGGFLGVTIALTIFCWRKKIDIRRLADIIVLPIAIGLALGRVGNFINQELYGTVTTLPWAIAIPGVDGLRHPTQIYAVIKDLFIAAVCFWHLQSVQPYRAGQTFSVFLLLYGLLRFCIEYLRVQEHASFEWGLFSLTRGQLLTLPILLFGIVFWWWAGKGSSSSERSA